jgi:phospholipase D1/2
MRTFGRVMPEQQRDSEGPAPLLCPGRTCWRQAHVERMDVLIDADRYFSVLHETLCRARRSIYIVGWDIDSRVQLARDTKREEPTRLASLLSHLAGANARLDVRVLAWDYAPIFLLEREFFPRLRFGARTHERVRFRLDDVHPAGGSHHQKIVVVDDRVAFCGGLDLCDVRWDTREHLAGDRRRVSKSGRPYRPHHDVQVIVEGEAARVLADVVRHRWIRATGERLDPVDEHGDPWPPELRPSWRDVRVGIARTMPAWEREPCIREVEQLWLDSIREARRFVYIEATHLTSRRVGEALVQSLEADRGPEVILVLPALPTGWLEGATLGVLRDRTLERLRSADRHRRFGVFCPYVPGAAPGEPRTAVNVHGKVCVVDDRLLRVGSANLTNRSMGLDTECDLVLDGASRGDVCAGIVRVRDELLAEHLDVSAEDVHATIERTGSILATIEHLRHGDRTLQPCEPIASPRADRVLPDARLVDPDRPLQRAEIMKLLMTEREPRRWQYIAYGWWGILGCTLVVAGTTGWLSASDIIEMLARVSGVGLASVVIVAVAFIVGGLLLVPVTLLIANSGMVFGPWWGSVHALIGAFASAAVYYWMGRGVGRDLMERISSPRIRDAARAVARRGLLAVAAVRMVPIAPHAVVGLVAGASRIGFRDYMLGSVVGMAPGAVALVLVGHGLALGVRGAHFGAWLPVLALALVALAVAWLLQRRLGQGSTLHDRTDSLDPTGPTEQREPTTTAAEP